MHFRSGMGRSKYLYGQLKFVLYDLYKIYNNNTRSNVIRHIMEKELLNTSKNSLVKYGRS